MRDRISSAIRNYLIPRLERPHAPLVVVFAGPTGSGKSTLVNTLTGLDLTIAGALRPTTSKPLVLAGHAADGELAVGGTEADVIVGGAPVLEHMTFIDTPDIDSTSTEHRVIAESLIDRADIVVFVVSANRYADAAPWEVLRRAMSRGATVVPVVNRLGPGNGAVVTDFSARLRAAGLDVAPVRVPEHHLPSGAQHIPTPAVRELRRRLFRVAKAQRDHQVEVTNRVLNNTADQAADLARRIRDLAAEVAGVADSIVTGLSEAPSVEPDPGREWARVGSGRSLVERFRGDDWEARVVEGLTGEIEGRLRSDIVRHAYVVVESAGGMTAVAAKASGVIEGAVSSWLRFTGRVAEAEKLSERSLVAAALIEPVAGQDPDDPVARVRRDLDGRLAVVWQHFATMLAEGWSSLAGDPDPGNLQELAAEVVAARQLVDA